MAQFATDTDLLEYVPDVKKYGIQEFLTEHEKTYDDIIRLLNIKWWPTTRFSQYDVSVLGGVHTLDLSGCSKVTDVSALRGVINLIGKRK